MSDDTDSWDLNFRTFQDMLKGIKSNLKLRPNDAELSTGDHTVIECRRRVQAAQLMSEKVSIWIKAFSRAAIRDSDAYWLQLASLFRRDPAAFLYRSCDRTYDVPYPRINPIFNLISPVFWHTQAEMVWDRWQLAQRDWLQRHRGALAPDADMSGGVLERRRRLVCESWGLTEDLFEYLEMAEFLDAWHTRHMMWHMSQLMSRQMPQYHFGPEAVTHAPDAREHLALRPRTLGWLRERVGEAEELSRVRPGSSAAQRVASVAAGHADPPIDPRDAVVHMAPVFWLLCFPFCAKLLLANMPLEGGRGGDDDDEEHAEWGRCVAYTLAAREQAAAAGSGCAASRPFILSGCHCWVCRSAEQAMFVIEEDDGAGQEETSICRREDGDADGLSGSYYSCRSFQPCRESQGMTEGGPGDFADRDTQLPQDITEDNSQREPICENLEKGYLVVAAIETEDELAFGSEEDEDWCIVEKERE